MEAPEEAQNIGVPIYAKNRKGEIQDFIGTVKRCDIDDYLTIGYIKMESLYYRFKNGFGLPGNKPWDEQPDHFLRAIDIIDSQYKIARGD